MATRKTKKTARKEKRKVKQTKRKAERKAGKRGIKKLGKFVKKTGKGIAETAALGILAPFKGPMKKALDKRGIAHTGKLDDISEKFFNYVVKDKDIQGTYEPGYYFLAPALIPIIIAGITAFFKFLEDKKASGAEMSEEESAILDQIEEIENTVEDEAMKELQAQGQIISTPFLIAIIAAILLVVIFLFMGKKK